MKIIFLTLLVLHGLIHLLGFFKAFHLAPAKQLTKDISKTRGLLWLLAAVLAMMSASMLIVETTWWWTPALAGIVLSQSLIFTNWRDAKFGTVPNIIVLLAAVVGYGFWSFSGKYENDVRSGIAKTSSSYQELLTESDIAHLPAPVQKYIRYTNALGKPKVQSFKVEIDGQIRQDEDSPWMPFTSEQHNFLEEPTRLFFMSATMKKLPVAGYHRFDKNDASMDIRLLSLFPVQYHSGEEMQRAETVTFFNDLCIMAPAALIDERIEWKGINERETEASFTNNGITVSAKLLFDEDGALVNFISNDRYALQADGSMKQLPWSTPLSDYRYFKGYRLPSYGDAVYTYERGDVAYANLKLVNVEYNPAGTDDENGVTTEELPADDRLSGYWPAYGIEY